MPTRYKAAQGKYGKRKIRYKGKGSVVRYKPAWRPQSTAERMQEGERNRLTSYLNRRTGQTPSYYQDYGMGQRVHYQPKGKSPARSPRSGGYRNMRYARAARTGTPPPRRFPNLGQAPPKYWDEYFPPQGDVEFEAIMPQQEPVYGTYGYTPAYYGGYGGGGGGGRTVNFPKTGGPGRIRQQGALPRMANLPRWMQAVTTWKGVGR